VVVVASGFVKRTVAVSESWITPMIVTNAVLVQLIDGVNLMVP
jgi:hypothetical protein